MAGMSTVAPVAPIELSADVVAEARRIEEAGLNNLHTRRQLLYDGWLLLLSPGRAKRARSVNPHVGSTLPLDEKIRHCEALYERHGLPMLFRITPFAQPPALDAALGTRGYVAFDRTLVQTASLDRPPDLVGNADIELSSPLPDAFVEAVGEMRESPLAQRQAHLERLAQSPLDIRPVLARIDGRPVAAGLVSVEGGIAGLFDIVTTPNARGIGIGTRVTAALIAKAWERGVRRLFLQVDETNAPALAVYRKFGFATRYTYHYRARPGTCR
jgi:ribosomal protein S18 acetylase RimI-like enzyme